MRHLTPRSLLLVGFETMIIVVAIAVAAFIRLGTWDVLLTGHGLAQVVLVAVVSQACLYYVDLYDLRRLTDRRDLFISLMQALGAASLILAAIYFWFPMLVIGRGVFMIAAAIVIVVGAGWRLMFEWTAGQVGPRERLLIVGTNPAAVELARELFERRNDLGVDIVGFVDPDPARLGAPVLNPGVIGTVDDIPGIVRQRQVDRVVVSLADARGKLPMQKLLEMKLDGVTFDHLTSVYEKYTGKIAIENLRPSWIIFSGGFKKSPAAATVKRLVDVTIAFLALIATLPLMALVALAVRLTSAGPVFYHQRRVGLRGAPFTVHKFRTMKHNAEALSGPVWAAKDGDPRTTPIGGWLRRARLDELPQLVNVLRGEMSLVGPRPERQEFVSELTAQIPYYGQRHVIRPGLSGWAQVRYTYGASTEDAVQKLQYDLYYIKNQSLALDLYIMLETIKTVVLRKGA
jgi:sugar transferase (PEP-CTERM system associated)